MTVYRLLLALLCGIGLSTLTPLLLNGPLWISAPAMYLLLPGGFIAAIFFHSESPFIVMAANAVIYSGLVYVFLAVRRDVGERFPRLASIFLAVPVVVLVALSCIPSVNPMLPSGTAELGRQEADLQKCSP